MCLSSGGSPARPSTLDSLDEASQQLTALRVEAYIKHELHRTPRPGLAATIVEKSRSHHAVPLIVTLDGDVLFEEGGQLVDQAGQASLRECVLASTTSPAASALVKGVPFPSCSSRASTRTSTPRSSAGCPGFPGTRITAPAVRDVAVDGRDMGLSGSALLDYVHRHYPLTEEQFRDAERVGMEILR